MCVFCAAIPVAASLGAREQARQARETREAIEQGKQAPQRRVSAGQITVLAVSGLVAASVLYHTHLLTPL